MIDIPRILCPVDFSDCSRRALDHAVAVARWYRSRVTVLHVLPIAVGSTGLPPAAPPIFEPILLSPMDRERLTADLRQFVKAAHAAGVEIELEVAEGRVRREIVDRARSLPADLLVLGTHGRSGFERLLLGSVAEQVVRTAECPVLTVPSAAALPTPLFKRIICATDFSPAATAAVAWAASLAIEADSELVLLHVLVAPLATETTAFPNSTLAAYRAEYEGWATERLRDAVPSEVRECCVVTEVMPVGVAHREILRVAAERRAELIVMGATGRGPIERAFFGSSAQHVVRSATCPVLTVRAA